MLAEYGAPQGSIVEPILYIIFINGVTKCVPDTNFVLFDDDASFFVSDNSLACQLSRTNDVLSCHG